jgi:hypothetical protein
VRTRDQLLPSTLTATCTASTFFWVRLAAIDVEPDRTRPAIEAFMMSSDPKGAEPSSLVTAPLTARIISRLGSFNAMTQKRLRYRGD